MALNHAAIVGLGVRFPECNTPSDFWSKLLDGVNMVTENDRRWPAGKYGLPKRNATLAADLEKFDGVFYGMTGVHAQATTPIIRLALATTFEAFNDAGLHPNQLRGSETGVYASTGIIEDVVPRMRDMEKITGYELMGGAPSMLSGRISFTYDLRGPSKTLDTACSGFHYAVHDAATDIATGRCQAAVAVGAQLTLSPSMSLAFHRMKMTSNDGACKTFDSSADGFARAEALGTLLLLACDRSGENRSFPSRDPYAVLLGSATNSDGYKTEGITFPNRNAQVEVYKRALAVAGIQSSDVSYVEAHGTGTVVGDAAELWGIDRVYGSGASRTKDSPLLLGAVKSCTGHGEAAAGMLALVKVLLSFREGKIPGNLHFKTPNTHSEGLANGWLKPITTTTEWNGNYASVTGFGFSGSNVHLVLGRHTPKQPTKLVTSLPDNLKDLTWLHERVKLFYGRNAAQVKTLLSLAELFPKSDIGPWGPPLLIDKDHADEMYGNVGTVVEGSGPAVNVTRPTEKPKLVLLFIGNGGNWKGMGKKLYFASKVFRHYVDECNTILQKHCGDNRLYESVVGDMTPEEMVKNGTWMGALVAVEVGIFHILKDEFGLLDANPDYKFMGHSTGDFLCGYVDGSLNLEQTLMMAVARDLALGEAGLIGTGQVIAAGMTHVQATAVIEEVLKDDAESLSQVAVGCINSRDSVTISGLKPAVLKIYEVLQNRGIFTRLVNTGGVASHSPMLKKATEGLIKILSHWYKEKKLRSDKWITMSPPFVDGSDGLKYCSAEYFMNNYTSRVYFEDVQRSLPKECLVLEIGPSPILSSHIRRTRPDITLIPTLRPDSDDVVNVCETFSALWRSGLLRPHLADQEGRPAVAHRTDSLKLREALAYWEPTDACPVPDIIPGQHNKENEVTHNTDNSTPAFKLQLAAGEPHNFLLDHVVAKQPMVPAAFYLAEVVPWALVTQKRLLVNSDNTPDPQQGLRYRKVRFLRAVPLSSSGQVTFHCHLTRIAEEEIPAFKFHILQPELEEALVTGECAVVPQPFASENKSSEWKDVGVSNTFGHDEFYSMVWGNAASFGPKFATVQQLKLNACGNNHHGAYVNGSGSWTLLMDGMAQAYFVAKYFLEPDESEGYGHPVLGVREMVVSNPLVPLQESSEKLGVQVELDMETGRVQGPLCIVQGLQTEPFPWKVVKGPGAWVGAQVFIPMAVDKDGKRHIEPVDVSWPASSMAQGLLSLVEQTSGPAAFHPNLTCWVLPNESQSWLKDALDSVLPASLRAGLGKSLPPALVWDASTPLPPTQYSLVLVPVDQNPNNALSLAAQLLPDWGFLVAWGSKSIVLPDQKFLDSLSVEIVSNLKSKDGFGVLLRKLKVLKVSSAVPYSAQNLRGEEFVKLKDKIIEAVDACETSNTVWLHGECPGIMGLYKCLRREPGDRYNNLRLLSGSKDLLDWSSRVDVGIVLAHPIDKQPGTYVHIPLPDEGESLPNRKGDPFLEGVHIEFADKGDLDSAVWVQNTHLAKVWEEINEEELNNLVRVDAVGLNFRDVLLAYGKLTRYAYFGRSRGAHWPGSEFSGQAISGPFAGQRVMGMANDAMATVVRAPEILLWKVPTNVTWTPEQCASIPCAYATVYYALIVRANLQKGQSILVQAAAGAVGMAALRVAFWRGCTNVYATCSQAKREALLSTFPELKSENVFNSRNDSFEREVLLKTQGRGVDIVLNSLAGNLLEAGLRCVASNGHFLELGKVDMVMHTPLDLNYLLRNVTFHCIDVDLAISSPVWQVTKNLLQQGLESGEVIPIPVTSFPPDQVPQMLRFMAEGRHTGKVVLDLNGKVPPKPTQRFQPRKDGVYVITGGLGGVGLRLGKWLVDLGARHIVLVSRTGVRNGMQAQRIGHLTFKGAKVTVSTQDAGTSLESAIKLIDESIANHDNLPIAGVFHLAMVLDDKLFENHTKESWERVLTCKADGGKFIEEAMAQKGYWDGDLSIESKPFLCHFSSVSSGFGSAGQSNYGLANAMLDDNAHVAGKRRVLSIQWGGIGRFGVITRAMSSGQGGKYAHISLQDVESCFQVLESLLLRSLVDYPVVTSFAPGVGPADEDQSESSGDVVQRVLDLLRCSADSVAENVTLGRLGMDSLQAIEVQNVIRSATGKSIPAAKLRTTTLAQLKALSAEE